MSGYRIFTSLEGLPEPLEVPRSSPEYRYLTSVRRARVGEEVTCLDGRGGLAEGIIARIDKRALVVEATRGPSLRGEPPLPVTVAVGLAKKDTPELVIQKATELGVGEVVLFHARRSVRQLDDVRQRERRLERWDSVAREAVRQCGRSVIPRVAIVDGVEALSLREGTLGVVFWEEGNGSLGAVLAARPVPSGVTLVIGPEGGLESDEVARLEARGFVTASLGPRILRTATAVLASLAVVQYVWGDLARGIEEAAGEEAS